MSSLPNDVASGSGTQKDPYVLQNNSGTVTLESGKFYILENGTTIGTKKGNNTNDSGIGTTASTGGIVVNGASLEVQGSAQINGTLDISKAGSSVMMDTPSSWVEQTNLPDHSSVGGETFGYPALQNAVVSGLLNNDGTPNSNTSLILNGIPGKFGGNSGKIGIVGQVSGVTGSHLIIESASSSNPIPEGGARPSEAPGVHYGVNVLVPKQYASTTGSDGLDYDNVILSYTELADGSYKIDGGTTSYTCFLSGSMIRTPEGDVAVENIKIGDEVVTFDWKNNREVTQPVVWVGKSHAFAYANMPDDEAGYPVRVQKNAIAEGVPYKDMLITPEHCLFFEGKFVPARMLVNGVSIVYDKSITSYEYYHIETEQHSVITADGMLTESYLDTGNRSSFRQEGKVASLRNIAKSWESDAGAPLCVDRAFVEPLFRKLEARNKDLASSQASVDLTQDPDVHLVTESGAVIRPIRHDGPCYSFMLPANIASVRIVSRASRAADVIGPFVDDRRMMGVAVADVYFVTAKHQEAVTAHLQVEKPSGWHDTDWTDCAWTNGDAVLPLGDLTQDCMGILSLNIRAAGPYQKQDTKVILNSKYSA
ncbi:Hint domain-containing protein [Acetobacter sp. DmW_136]|uniref:Hint domain-containing protein n=1 Tax=Acetobacter sp. DmW_136 TaxID=2591091 RepID=UPI00123B1068|nr:Hint domain-containing protein [Acetobacter sp. DmW_136]KAA8384962.1 Hint domain-containing protein [Acetobacter sp. DmW_136]